MKTAIKTVKAYLFMFSLLVKTYPQRLFCLPIYVLFSALLPFVPILFSARIIDSLVSGKNYLYVVILILLMCICGLVMEFTVELINEYDVVWDACFAFETTGMILKKYMELDMADMETEEIYAKYNMANAALEKGIGYFLDSVKDILISIIELAAASLIILSLHPLMILILLIITVLASFLQRKSLLKERAFDENTTMENRKYRYLYDTVNDFQYGKEIRVYGLKEKLAGRIFRLNDSYFNKLKRTKQTLYFLQSGYQWINLVTNACIYIYIIFLFAAGRITIGSFTIILGTVEKFKAALTSISDCIVKMNDMGIRIHDLQDFLAVESKLDTTVKQNADIQKLSDYEIRFEHVGFHYPNSDRMVLKDINIVIPYGEKLIIVGENGAGKSTFVKLLFRIYDPTEGAIYVGGRNIKDFPLEEYHHLLASVFQDFRMFSFSIRDNIVFGSEAYESDDKIMEILKRLGMDKKIRNLPKGLDTCLNTDYEEDGVMMSGGELQKLAIARAIYRNADILVVDEPTSALDAISEADTYRILRSVIGKKTGIFISHRMSSARFGDKIALFEQGRITEYGTFREVMQLKRRFFELYHLQAQYYV